MSITVLATGFPTDFFGDSGFEDKDADGTDVDDSAADVTTGKDNAVFCLTAACIIITLSPSHPLVQVVVLLSGEHPVRE